MKKISACLMLFLFCSMDCNRNTDLKQSLIGKVYQDVSEIKQLDGYTNLGGGILWPYNNNINEFGTTKLYKDENKICLIEKIFFKKGEEKPYYKLLDVLLIQTNKEYKWVDSPFFEMQINLVGIASFDSNNTCTLIDVWQIIIEDRNKDIIRIVPVEKSKVEYISGFEYSGIIFKK